MAHRGTISALIETTFSDNKKLPIDTDAKVIRGVKILGKQSRNGYEYSDGALAEAARLYEGVQVNYDHPPREKPNTERAFGEGGGVLKNIVAKPGDGVYGDFHYFEKHPNTPLMLERAEREPQTFGFSHNADGRKTNFRGKTIVESIARVRSVDVVGRPATTTSCFESEDTPVQTTIKAVLESAKAKDTKHWGIKGLSKLLEMDPMMAEAPMEAPAADADADGQIDAAFKAAINKVLDEGGDIKAKLKKIKDILTAQEKLMGAGESEPSEPAEPTPESVKVELQQLRAEKASRALLESLDREVTDVRISAVAAVPDAQRRALIESWPKRSQQPGKPTRSVPLTESEIPGEYKPAKSTKEYAAAIR